MAGASRRGYGEDGIYFDHRADARGIRAAEEQPPRWPGTTEILRQSPVIASAYGVERLLVACDHDNIASMAVIEADARPSSGSRRWARRVRGR
jgi:hypothetical protein